MTYSICSKCRKKISIDMDVCPHCGNKITSDMFNEENVCKVNGTDYDLTVFLNDIMGEEEISDKAYNELRNLVDCASVAHIYSVIYKTNGKVPKEYNAPTKAEMKEKLKGQKVYIPKCPTCGSPKIHSIGFGERTYSVNLFGLSSKKFNKSFQCDNCGYTW